MNELKKHRDELIAERDALEASIPGQLAAWRDMPNAWRNGNCVGSPEATAAVEKISADESRVRSISAELETLDSEIDYRERLENADESTAQARQLVSDSASAVSMLEGKRRLLFGRLQAIQKDMELALEAARQAELDAANLYARSIASGDSKGEKAANTEMQKASNQLIEADEHARRQELLTTALQAEIDSIDTQIVHAQKQGRDALNSALAATEIALGDEWNHLAEQLVAVGARILAANGHRGGNGMILSRLSIPGFGPSARELQRGDVLDRSKGLTLADLLGA
jgi:vacuolar-type H+-ATPase subunit I/STV1